MLSVRNELRINIESLFYESNEINNFEILKNLKRGIFSVHSIYTVNTIIQSMRLVLQPHHIVLPVSTELTLPYVNFLKIK